MKRPAVLVIGVLALAAAAGGGYYFLAGSGDKLGYKLARVERGTLTAAVAASGTLNPVMTVQVGSQVSGQIKEIFVDFNSPVKAGQLIARIDPETFEYRVRQAEADLEATRSAVNVQRAQVLQAQVTLQDAQRDLERKTMLVERKFISASERDKAQTVHEGAKAQLQVAEAQARNSEAVVRQREAQLAQARVDLSRTEIRSPVDGIVVKRSVDRGQTVAASLQAPELFIIARNLSDMQVETSIDEADVGRIHVDQKASFTVDAFPGKTFEGEVRQVRKAAQVVSNVVTYTVIVSAANPDLALLPGMTANVRIVSSRKDGILKVVNGALRFKPPAQEGKPAEGPAGNAKPVAGGSGRVWVVGEAGQPKALPVRLGITDGTATEIVADEIREGTEVIVGLAGPGKNGSGPAGPRMF